MAAGLDHLHLDATPLLGAGDVPAVWRYSLGLAFACSLPWAIGMSGLLYLVSAIVLNAVFLRHAWRVHRHYTDLVARKAFTWSII
jgi:protoheme IX farnesyltransferase